MATLKVKLMFRTIFFSAYIILRFFNIATVSARHEMTVKCKSNVFCESESCENRFFTGQEKEKGKDRVHSPAELLIIDAAAFARAFVLTSPTARAFVPVVKSTREP